MTGWYICVVVAQSVSLTRSFSKYIIDEQDKLSPHDCPCGSQWPRGLRRRSSAAHLLRLWVRIPPGAWMFVCCECYVLSGRGLCDGLITRPEESYRLWRVVVCDQETSKTRRLKPTTGLWNYNHRVVTLGKQTDIFNPTSLIFTLHYLNIFLYLCAIWGLHSGINYIFALLGLHAARIEFFLTDVTGQPPPSSGAKQTMKNVWITWHLQGGTDRLSRNIGNKIPTYLKSQKIKDLILFYLSTRPISVNISAACESNSTKLPTAPAMTDECCTPHG